MSGDPTDVSKVTPQPATLGYARHVGEYPSLQNRHWLAVLLIGLAALSGIWSIILGAMSLADVWFFGTLLCVGGICLCWATLGKLSAKGTRLRAALVLLAVSILMYMPLIVIAHQLYQQQRARYANQLSTSGDVRRPASQAELETFSFELFRNQALISVTLAFGCTLYTGAQLIARRGVDFN